MTMMPANDFVVISPWFDWIKLLFVSQRKQMVKKGWQTCLSKKSQLTELSWAETTAAKIIKRENMYNKNNPCHGVHRGECQCETQNIVTFSGSKINKTIQKKNYMFFEINFTWLIDRLFLSSFTPPLPLPSNPTRFMSSMWFFLHAAAASNIYPWHACSKSIFSLPSPAGRRLARAASQVQHGR